MVDINGSYTDYASQKRKLAEKYVRVQDEWIEACMQWLSSEAEGNNLSPNQLQGLIYEQWLMSDLIDISTPSLPTNIDLQLGTGILKGTYNLQVNYAYNIGTSAYSQLQKLNGLSVDDQQAEKGSKYGNSTLSSNRTTFKGSKTTRTLFFELSDGCQTIKAVEYIPIPTIPDCITQGLKVQMKGNIPYRDGILLISPDNISILGGSAEDLVNEFNLKNIFNNMLSNCGTVKGELANTTRAKDGSSSKKTLAVQSTSAQTKTIIQSKKENFVQEVKIDEDFENLLEDELLAVDDIFFDENIPEEADPINPNLDKKEAESNVIKKCSYEGDSGAPLKVVNEKRGDDDTTFLLEFLKEKTLKTSLVKVYIVTFLSKLDVTRTSYKLTVCIDDGSAVAVANILSHVIEKLLGFPPMIIHECKENSRPVTQSIKQVRELLCMETLSFLTLENITKCILAADRITISKR